jgi:radical SAM-linked protein
VVQRLVFRIGVVGETRYLSHLETLNAWLRALRRARAPLAWSEGFHPHPRIAFSGARPVAEESLGDYMDVLLVSREEPGALLSRLSAVLPAGLRAYSVEDVPLSAPSLMSRVAGADYLFLIDHAPSDLAERAQALLDAPELIVERPEKARKKKGRFGRGRPQMRRIDLRPNVRGLRLALPEDAGLPLPLLEGQAGLWVSLDTVGGRGARPAEIVAALGLRAEELRVIRLDTRFAHSAMAEADEGEQEEEAEAEAR